MPYVDLLIQVAIEVSRLDVCMFQKHVLRSANCEQRPKRYLSDYRGQERGEHLVEICPEFLGKSMRNQPGLVLRNVTILVDLALENQYMILCIFSDLISSSIAARLNASGTCSSRNILGSFSSIISFTIQNTSHFSLKHVYYREC